MNIKRLFPIDKVPYGVKIILYGAGENGRLYWNQCVSFNWCEIVMVVDRNFNSILSFPCKVVSHDKITKDLDFDYIVLTIADKRICGEIIDDLVGRGIDRQKIINASEGYFYRDSSEIITIKEDDSKGQVLAGFSINKAVGDQVIFLKLFQMLRELAPSLKADIYCPANNSVKSILFNQAGVRNIEYKEPSSEDRLSYDLFIEGEAFAWNIYTFCKDKIRRVSPPLYELLVSMCDSQIRTSVSTAPAIYSNLLVINRARILGLNRYNYNLKDKIEVYTEDSPDIYIDQSFEEEFKSLGICEPYVTFHYGASSIEKNKTQVKIWPKEYMENLIACLKEAFPSISLVQIGEGLERINGADNYILDKQLDVTKYALKGALCHFDCESGLVHLATALGTKCFVVFGPTPMWFFGYEKNENIGPEICGECAYMTKDWYTNCIKYDRPECMYSITPEKVMSRLKPYILEKFGG